MVILLQIFVMITPADLVLKQTKPCKQHV